MKIIQHIADLRNAIEEARTAHRTADFCIGFVPTMGALHAGHASLIARSVKECSLTVVSVFVNPTQFNDPKDLRNYPRTMEADCELIESLGGNIVFAPTVEEMYPEVDNRQFSYPPIDTVMEGEKRPGHFNGVCQIVSKLFDAVQPNRAYFGEKDFQQIAVVRAMVNDLGYNIELVSCPIVREKDGLAMSSRNTLLSVEERQKAVHISQALFESRSFVPGHRVDEVHTFVVEKLNAIEGLEVEYFDIVNADTLQSITNWDEAERVQGCITVFCGTRPVRLIDNISYKPS
ncbi:MAG: pantoate--beta-alanine ligase [Bacteroidales bacterium]|nr:pantoate--beta-alanine ligase [Bacteroidales bacterium]